MAVYNKHGVALDAVYNSSGEPLERAYDAHGNVIFESGERTTLKIMSYNVGQWWTGTGQTVPTAQKSEYYTLQNGTFDSNRPDILFMQEYLNTWCQDGSLASELLNPYFDNQEVTNPQGMIGHSICTNGIVLSNYTSHNFTTNKGNYPTYESAEITVDGKSITIVNTHNDYVLSYQTQEVTDLLAFLANLDSFVLCGDFNINLSTEDTTDDQYLNSVKRFLDAGYHVGNCVVDWIPTYYGTASPTGGKFTDQIVTSADIRIDNIYADTAKLTDGLNDKIDHLPLIVEISFLSEEAST